MNTSVDGGEASVPSIDFCHDGQPGGGGDSGAGREKCEGGTPSDKLGMGVRYYNRDWRGHHSVPEEASTFLGVTHQWIWEDVTLLCYRPGYYLVVTVEILALK